MTATIAPPRPSTPPSSLGRTLLNKVPEVTIFFWIIKILATTVGETAADFLNVNLNFGLTGTSVVIGALLLVVLGVQFKTRRYVPGVYWLAVVLISVVGTLITDNLTDNFGIPLPVSTAAFAAALAATFAAWFAVERTLSIHSILTSRREGFYWLTILFTFALGTAAGDLVAERLNLGYLVSALAFGGVIAAITVAHLRFKLNAVLSFWLAYILTRPLGASLGDLLSQSTKNGGFGLGTIGTSAVFLTAILVLVPYLAVTRRDVIEATAVPGPGLIPVLELDRDVIVELHAFAVQHHGFVIALKGVSALGSAAVYALLFIALAVWLIVRGALRLAAFVAVTVAGGAIVNRLVKGAVERARPMLPDPVAHAAGYSFPSGHAQGATVAAGVLLLVLLRFLHGRARAAALVAAATWIALVCFSRVGLGVHYVTDVVAGVVLGGAWLAATATLFSASRPTPALRAASS